MNISTINRETKETKINLTLQLNSQNPGLVGETGVGFFDHMLASFCVHGRMSINLTAAGDLHVDSHHTVEDVGIAIGRALREIIGDGGGVRRFGTSFVPMDESLARCVVDLSGRAHFSFNANFAAETIGNYCPQLTREFFAAIVREAKITLHIELLYGENDHHKTEAIYKAAARAISEASEKFGDTILSAKGVL